MAVDKILIIVSSIVVDEKNRILLLKRGETGTFCNFWQLPEGKIEGNERPINALEREMLEEVGVGIKSAELKNINKTFLEVKSVKYLAIRIIFKVILNSKKIKISDEHSDFGWFELGDFKNLKLLPGTEEAVKNSIQ